MAAGFWSIAQAHGSKRVSASSETVGYATGLLTWVLAGGVFVAAKSAVDEMPSWTLCFWRLLIATMFLLPLVRHHFPDMAAFLRAHGLKALVIGALGLGITQGMMFTAMETTSAVNAGIIFSTAPIITLVMAHFFLHESLGPWQVVGSVVAFFGIVVIAVQGSLAVLLGLDLGSGDLIVVAAAVVFSSYCILLKRAKFTLERLPLLVILLAGGALSTLPFFLYELWNGEHSNLGWNGYLALAYAAIPGGALMYLLYNWSIDILGASRAQGLLYSQMIFTAILAWLILGEAIEWYHFVGAGLIIAGVICVTFLKPKQAPQPVH
ncbi:MAG: DMT family transporter [Bauldia litoralis]